MTATFQRDVLLTACYKNNLTGTCRWNNIHTTHNYSTSNGSGVLTSLALIMSHIMSRVSTILGLCLGWNVRLIA